MPVPIVGDLLKLGDKPHRSLAKLAQIYGPIMKLQLGRVTTVVISSRNAIKEALQKQDLAFSSRSVPNAVCAHDQYKYSVTWLPVGSRWRSLRKILNSHIFSMSRLDAVQSLRRQKVAELVEFTGKCCREGVAVDVGCAAFTTSLNLLSNTLFSVDLADQSEDLAREFRDLVWQIMVEAGRPNLVDYFPVLARFDPQQIRGRMTEHYGKVLRLIGRLINKRLELRKSSKSKAENDVLDVLINLSEKSNEEIDRTHIERLFLDLFIAGTDTTSSTVEWAMAEVLRSPKVLEKARAELQEIVDIGKPIEESDIARLRYLQAVVKETMRIHPPAPFLIPRKVETDVELGGYTVPQGAQVLVNAWAIGRDPNLWPEPTHFMPERFLESEIDVRGRDFELIPFGSGRRICPGLPLAMLIVQAMVGSLLNSFDWKLEGGIAPEDLDMEEKFGITLQKAQPLRAIPIPL
ncbi:Geraniol 8-hydroxylase [Bertholletia excelsa]